MKYHVNPFNNIVRKYTIKEIFADNWCSFLEEAEKNDRPIRETILKEVHKIIGCQDPQKGFTLYICPKCN